MKKIQYIFIILCTILFLMACSKEEEREISTSYEIFLRVGHPVYYDKISDAEEFWKKEWEITVRSDYSPIKTYKDDIELIYLEAPTDRINLLRLNINDTNKKFLNFDEAAQLTKNYLPHYFESYYQKMDSYIISSADESTFFKVLEYSLTEEGIVARENTKEIDDYGRDIYTISGSIYVYFHGKDNITSITIADDIDNSYWDSNLIMNGLEKQKWEFDLLQLN
ncbi:TPA: hypothetical protein U1B91_001192 [Streptococcus suis]|uniref:hypothetical protein n=1 Tax=Streptococcus suis TaxID=1307 RepID=UPI002AA4B42E|nr:hypothetical protein [Streptococcus suis]